MQVNDIRGEAGIVTHQVATLRDRTGGRRILESLAYRACHDALTGLANRYLLQDRFDQAVARARRSDRSFALALLDLDGFKSINDQYGHDVGDGVLRDMATRLKNAVRGEDTVVRLPTRHDVACAGAGRCRTMMSRGGAVRSSLPVLVNA